MAKLEFWYEFASTYSYLTVMRIEEQAEAAGVEIEWRPFLLGPIFKSQGWDTSPFNLFPAKGRYMVRDIERIANARGQPFRMPPTFPVNGLNAARLALLGVAAGWCPAFTRSVFAAQFQRGEDISRPEVLVAILDGLGVDPAEATAAACSNANKQALRLQTEVAMQRGIFGAPSFITSDGELFWGDDRLEQALAWARR
ncbi:2-hydroxychromene-2-carboxylate isomerase [Hyphomicrobium sp. NDB2Meth4]|uniref:2-hydroxychromene-2-carboxylate isomerase n=1 Tax=Hyphomicrobium sp. NDB2Meth4 TaxID=1892846 RepID=UPI0009308552|nr:2-hydroxychromene-2-carboxylate isomerase [Hyphomicrobium sp. NDB2Meth4]